MLLASGFSLLAWPLRGEQAGPAPAGLTVVLLLDVSSSVAQLPLQIDQRYPQVFNAFLNSLKPTDRAAVGVIAGRVRFSAVTGNKAELTTSIRSLLQVADVDRLGPSPLWDAIDAAITLTRDPAGRPAIVLFSDGKSTGNTRSLDDVIERARQERVMVSAVVEGAGSNFLARTKSALDPADQIARLTDSTGGRRLLDRPTDPRERNPGPLISVIMDGLHQQ